MMLYIDYSLCTNCGACAELYPFFFEMKNDKPWFINHDKFVFEEDRGMINCCPFRAIIIE